MAFEMETEEGVVDAAERIAMLGMGGIGKSNFASGAPYPFIIDLERGSTKIKNVARNKKPITDYATSMAAIEWLRTAKHPYKTAVIDTLDRFESYCHKHLCEEYKVDSIEKILGGFGKGYTIAYERFRDVFSALEKLTHERDMHVIVLAHQKVEKVKNPSGEDYGRFAFKVNGQVGGLMYEACDHVLFATTNIVVTGDIFDDDRPRAIGGEKRIIHTIGTPTYLAKTRARIPDPIPLSWHDWVCHVAAVGFPRLLRDTVVDNARRHGDADVTKSVLGMIREGVDVKTLARMNLRLNQLLGQDFKDPQESPATPAASAPAAATTLASPAPEKPAN